MAWWKWLTLKWAQIHLLGTPSSLNWGEGPVIVTSNYSFGKRYIKFTERWMESLKVAIYTDKNKEQHVSRFYQYDFSEIKLLPCQKVSYYLDKGLIFLKTFLPTRILSGMRLRQYYQIRLKLCWDENLCVEYFTIFILYISSVSVGIENLTNFISLMFNFSWIYYHPCIVIGSK